jgi:UDP-N-acetylglucosamine--N-acetylmuramyl-(pentapeptide) pyrophosphoryl-undecaprenol N-acetylglucosamine transferase
MDGRSYSLPVSSSNLGFLWRLPQKKREATRVLQTFGAEVVVGLGGRTSYPVLEAAKSLRIPVLLLEQNRVMGKANQKFRRSAARVCHAFPLEDRHSLPSFRWTGLPLRRRIMSLNQEKGLQDLKVSPEELVLLVLGGSQGAEVLNLHLPQWLRCLPPIVKERLHIIHVAGPGKERACFDAYQGTQLKVHVFPFREDVPSLLRRADLCILRGGGTTLCEGAALGKAMIVVPIPWHADQHQVKNAEFFAKLGAAVLLPQKDLAAGRSFEEGAVLFVDGNLRSEMGSRARKALPRSGTDSILKELELLAEMGRRNTIGNSARKGKVFEA